MVDDDVLKLAHFHKIHLARGHKTGYKTASRWKKTKEFVQ